MHNASGQSETLAPVYRTIYEITTNKSDPVEYETYQQEARQLGQGSSTQCPTL